MNLTEAIKEMSVLQSPTEVTVKESLEDGCHVLVADKNRYGDSMLKYDIHIRDGILYVCKLSDSTREDIVLTAESAAVFTDDYFNTLYRSYLVDRDVFIVDTVGYMHDADIRFGQFTHEAVKEQLSEGQVFFFNDVYSPFEGINVNHFNVYIIDVGIPGTVDVLKEAVATVPGAKLVGNPDQADFSILPLPPQVPGMGRMFKGAVFSKADMKTIKKQSPALAKEAAAKGLQPYTLMFFTSTAADLAKKNVSSARLQLASELSAAAQELSKKKGKRK